MRPSSTLSLPTLLTGIVAVALVARLAGFGLAWLPRAGLLAGLLVVMHLAAAARRSPPRLRDWQQVVTRHGFAIALGLLIALAFIVRLPGFGGDIGHVPLDIDEGRLAMSVKHFFDTGELEHLTVEHYPGAVFWLFALASFLRYLRDLTSGVEIAPNQLSVSLFVLSARMANIFVAGATVALTGLIGRQVSNAGAALLAAFLVAVVPLSVETTTVVRNDPGMVLAVMAAVYAALVFHRGGRRSWLIAAGMLAGVATGIKYSSVFAIAPALVAAAASGAPRERIRRCGLAVAAFAIAVIVTNHFVWADFPNFLRQLAAQVALTASGHWAATANPAAFYVMVLERFGVGWPLLLLAGAFAVYGLTTRRIPIWIFLSFPLLYLWFMTNRPSQFPRWVYPLLPFAAIAGAAAVSAVFGLVRSRVAARPRPLRAAASLVMVLVLLAALAPPVWNGVVSFRRAAAPPTHVLAEGWLREHASPGSVVVLGVHWLDLTGSAFVVRRVELETALNGELEQLSGADWLVVPEPFFGNPALRRLGLVQRFHADRSFSGHIGYDYEIYAVPKMPAPGS